MASLEEARQTELLAALSELGGGLTSEEDITFEGTRFVIPQSMNVWEAVAFLTDKAREDDQYMTFTRTFHYRPYDGARAAHNAMRKAFGMTRQQRTPWGDAPSMVSVEIGYGETEQVPWGSMSVPMLPDARITFDSTMHRDLGAVFFMAVEAPRKYRFMVEGLFELVEQELRETSIYRGKAFDGAGNFLDLSNVDPSRVIYSAEVMTQLEANVWSVIRHTQAMRDHGVSVKRAVLLEGPYGTGKTLAAYLTARESTNNQWTFVYCRPGDNVEEVMATARMYQPSVVFIEDIDVMGDAEGMSADMTSHLLDSFDGIANKGAEVLAVMTTNHVEKLHKGLCRPGRLDAIVHIGALDKTGMATLVRNVIPPALLGEIDYDALYDAMEGYLPAFVKEAVERSMRYAIARGNGVANVIETADLVNAANGLRAQHDLMLSADEHKRGDSLSEAMAKVVREASIPPAVVIDAIVGTAEQTRAAVSMASRGVVGRVRDALNSIEIVDSDGDYMNGEHLTIQD